MSDTILVQYRVDGETRYETDYARDLDGDGCRLQTDLPAGTTVMVRLPLSETSELMERLGRVEGTGADAYVRFIDGSDSDRETISMSVQSRDALDLPTEDLLYAPGSDEDDGDDTLPG